MAQSDGTAIVGAFLARERLAASTPNVDMPGVIEARPRVWFNPDLRMANFYTPAQLGAILSFLIIVLTAISIVREREIGTLEQLLVTPLRSSELLLGKAIPALLAAYLEFLGLLAIALFWFRVPCHGSLAAFMAFCAFYIVVEMGWGLLISSVATTQGQALMAAFFLNSLSMIMSGYIIPTEYMPWATQIASRFLPLRYFVIIARGIFLRGAPLSEFTPQLASLALLGLALYSLGAWRLRSTVE
jgi:ABC-2 type transport system permease protein